MGSRKLRGRECDPVVVVGLFALLGDPIFQISSQSSCIFGYKDKAKLNSKLQNRHSHRRGKAAHKKGV